MGDQLQTGELAKISFSLMLCKPADAVHDFVREIFDVRRQYSGHDTLKSNLMIVVDAFDMNKEHIGVEVIVEDVRAVFLPESIGHHPARHMIGSILFPNCGSIYEKVKVALTDGPQKCVVLHPVGA